ncbi:MAG: hypothetical protein R3A51_04285 [Nannocystaceae bacterium]
MTVAADTRAALDELIGRVMGRAASLVRLIERALPDCQLRPYASWRRRAHEPAAILRWGVDAAELGRSWRTPATALAWCRSIVDEGERGSVRVELLSADGLPLDGACAPTLD